MTSRRPLTRSYSGNGRTSSFGEEEGSSSNRESRNTYLSNVRPENRSTLCTVMAQLTEDIQPSFEKTLKSKAISENCNVKFTCVVSGIPAPELTWYKDDMEMDRYCGLPKYEIHRNGKNHTLQIYNCTLDDAAIYQASASNTKGIVSCSGVLEVGTMSEFLIHQRFFSKLKQKADNKKKELEDSKKKDKENVPKEPSEGSPQRSYRKRPGPPPPSKEEPHAVEQIGATAPEANGACAEIEASGPQTATAVVVEKVEGPDSLSKDNVAAKKIKISNGVDGVTGSGGSSRGRTIANGRQNSYDGGISLAQFLAETVSSQALEEKQAEKTCEMDTTVQGHTKEEERENEAQCREVKESEKVNVLVQEHERLRVNPGESPVEREKERERPTELHRPVTHPPHAPATKGHRRGHKDHDHHNIQASISSVLHSVKDFFFGKGKKDPHDHRDKEETEDYNSVTRGQPSPPQTPPIPRLEEYKTQPEDVVPLRSDGSREPSVVVVTESGNLELLKPLATQADEPEFRRKEQFPAPAPPSTAVPRVEEAAMSSQVDLKRPGEAVPMSGTPVLIEAKEKRLPKLLVTEEVAQTVTSPVAQTETEISPASLILCSPHHQTPVCGETSPSTVSFRTVESMSLPSVALETDSHGHKEVALDASSDKRLRTDSAMETGPLEPQDSHSASYLQIREKVEAQAEVQEYETRMETDLLPPALEEQIVFDSVCISKVPIPMITIQADNTVLSDSMEVNYTPLIQTVNTEDRSTVTTVDISNFNMQQGGVSYMFESTQGHNLSEGTPSALEQHEDTVPLHEGLTSAFDPKKELNANLKLVELPLSEIESDEIQRETSQRIEGLTLTIESEFESGKEGGAFAVVPEDLNDSLTLPEARNEEVAVRLSKEAIVVANPDDTGSRLVVQNVSQSETLNTTFEDRTDIKAISPQIVSNRKNIKTCKVEEPDLKEPMRPFVTLTTIPQILRKDHEADMSKVILKDNNQSDVPKTHSLIPTDTYLLNNTPTDKTQEVSQRHDKTQIQKSKLHSSAYVDALVPTPAINVSYAEENRLMVDVPVCIPETEPAFNAQVSEDHKTPPLVVPPIAITCDDIPVETISVPSPPPHTVTGPYQGAEPHVESPYTLQSPGKEHKINVAPLPADVTTRVLSLSKKTEAVSDAVTREMKPMKVDGRETDTPGMERIKDQPRQPDKPPVERLEVQAAPTHPALSPASLRRFLSRVGPRSDSPTAMAVPAITVGDSQSDKAGEELSGGSTPTSSLSCESSPRLKRRDSLSLIRSATPEELASGARRKIFMPRDKGEDGGEGAGLGGTAAQGVSESPAKWETPYMSPGQARRAALLQAPTGQNTPPLERRSPLMNRRKAMLEVPMVVEEKPAEVPDSSKTEEKPAEKEKLSPGQARRAALLQAPTGQNTPPLERRSPLMNRRKAMLEVPKVVEEKPAEVPDSSKTEEKPAEKDKLDPFKAPQVIRKIRGEPFPDASGNLKLWCQFFNILSDSTIKWYRDEEEILQLNRSGGDESQVALAIVQPSSPDCGVYGCTIKNEYGTDTTDFLLSVDILSNMLLKEDLEVGEEIEMTPLKFTKGLADVSCWGEKFFGRIMTKESHMGQGCAHKACRIKVIYGLDPVFESGSTCIMKVQSPIPYGLKEEHNLAERNLEMTKHEIKIQNMIREYCKIFAAEARVIENFGFSLEVIPQYLMYRPANSVPYATVEADLPGVFLRYSMMDLKGRLVTRTSTEVEQKCCAFQHWIHQWTHGNLVVTHLQGVETKLTNIRVVTKSKGYQGLTEQGSPQILEQFAAQHQCNYYCGLLGLRSLKAADNLQQTNKIKSSRSPLLNRKLSTSSSPQLHRKGVPSPQTSRKAASSPKVPRKAPGTEEKNLTVKATHEGTSEKVACKTEAY